jgi:hypothetical protein
LELKINGACKKNVLDEQYLQRLKVRAPLAEVLGSQDRSHPLEEGGDVNYGDGRWILRVTRS